MSSDYSYGETHDSVNPNDNAAGLHATYKLQGQAQIHMTKVAN